MRGQKKGKKTFSYFDWLEHPTRFCRKNQYDNKKRYPKFGMATYKGNSNNKIEIQLYYY